MANLAGMLQGIASDIGNPTQLSDGQKGLFNTLGASLAPMPAVNPDDPASLRAAAAEAMRRGDAQQARIYAVMASERENSVRQKNASQNALLDEGNAEIQAEAARKRQGLNNRQMGGYFANRLTIPGLADAVKMGVIPIQEAIKQQQTYDAAAMKEQQTNAREQMKQSQMNARAQLQYGDEGAYKPQSSFAKEAIDLGMTPGTKEFNDYIQSRARKQSSVAPTMTAIKENKMVDLGRISAARDTIETIGGLSGEAGGSQVALQQLRDLFPAGSRAVAEMKAFASAKSVPRRIKDGFLMWAEGDVSKATTEDYQAIANLIYEYEVEQAKTGIESAISLTRLEESDPEAAQRVRDYYFGQFELPGGDGWEIVGAKSEGAN
jgi:hypothetical protein